MNHFDQVISRLEQVILDRQRTRLPDSYTTQLLARGTAAIAEKVREEAEELAQATLEPGDSGRRQTIHEAADLLYHVLVLLADRGISLAEVAAELGRREGTSGLAEKAARFREQE